VNGASDPTSGNVALMETARALGELAKSGWKPRRTIVLASWDGEEWGLLGSTEWVEKPRDELARKAVAYVNSDSTGRGWLGAGGSHSLQAFVNEVARDVADPRGSGTSVLEAARARRIDQARTGADKSAARASRHLPLEALGSGSDYTAFIDHLTIASLNLGFGGDGGGGVYHSNYDTFQWFTRFSDGDFTHSTALSQVIGTALLRLADADVLPFEFGASADTLLGYAEEVAKLDTGEQKLDFTPLNRSLTRLSAAAADYEKALAKLQQRPAAAVSRDQTRLAELNRILYLSERAFRHDPGLPRREWFKHLAYAPGFYTGYGVKTLPGIREGIEQRQFDEARSFVPIVASAIERLAGEVTKAARIAGEIGR
jgi:N-acetylated-alpha-linked acidic dipeptidase